MIRLQFEIEQLKAQLLHKEEENTKLLTVIKNLKQKVAHLSAKPIKKVRVKNETPKR